MVNFLEGAGELATLIRKHDWASTPLGPIEQWPQSLQTITGFLVNSPIPIVLLWGADGVMIYNDAYSAFAGGRHPDLLGKNVCDGWPEVAAFNANVLKTGLAGGTLAYKDQELTLYRHGRPEQVWMDLDYSPVPDERGKAAGVIAIVVETTERRRTAAALRASEARYRLLFESMGEGFCIIESENGGGGEPADFRYVAVNPAFTAATGMDDPIGKTLREVLHEEAQGWIDIYQNIIASGEALRFERGLHAQGQVFELYAFRIEDGTQRRVGVIFAEITARKRAEAAREASESRLRELNAELERRVIERTQARGRTWQVSPDLLGAVNPQGHFETFNPAWTTLLGWSEEEMAGMRYFELLHPEDLERTRAAFDLVQRGEPVIRFPNRFRRKDGGYRWISWVSVPEDGMAYCSGRDITDDKAAEAELAQAQETLRQAQKMEAVGQLTGGIAHDFNNLLAVIGGSLELLRKRITVGRLDGIERYIDAAHNSTRRAADLTQRLLAFSRRQTLDPRPTDVNRLVSGMESLIRRTLGAAIEVEVVGAAGLWLTKVDAPQLENALLNLAINARDAMPDGGRVTIETANKWLDHHAAKQRELTPGQYISLCVTDTGTGMTPEVIKHVFEPFFTTKPLGRGTGLGLSMVHGFVRQSGGQVRIYSEPGKGTTMCLYLPRFAGNLETAELPGAAAGAGTGQGETVLIVDDEEAIRFLITDQLHEAGYRVLAADDGAAALKILQSDARIDLLITDVGLPGWINGRQVADAGRTARPHLKVLFITGYAENAAVGNGHLDPGMQVITKPFAMAALGARIREIIEG